MTHAASLREYFNLPDGCNDPVGVTFAIDLYSSADDHGPGPIDRCIEIVKAIGNQGTYDVGAWMQPYTITVDIEIVDVARDLIKEHGLNICNERPVFVKSW